MGLADDFLKDAQSAGASAPAAQPSLADQFMRDVQSGGAPAPAAVAQAPEPSFLDKVKQQAGNVAAGAVRGAGSIGATLLAPIDIAKDALAGKGLSLDSNRQRRSDMDAALTDFGAQPDSLAYQGGKLGGEVAGTLGTGGALANAITRVAPKVAASVPALVDALRTGGMSANGATGIGGAAIRAVGGAVNGAASSALVNPEDAGAGAITGAAAPVVVGALGKAASAIGASRDAQLAKALEEYGRKAPLNKAIQESLDAGYIIPPATVNPTVKNRALESVSGKMATQQLASVHNAEVTDGLVRKALDIPQDAPITRQALEDIRKEEGKAYAAVAALPVQPAQKASGLTNTPAAAAINPKQMLEDLKQARNDAQGWFASYNRSASPEDLKKAKAAEALATQLDGALEQHAAANGRPDLVQDMRDARVRIAKTYTVERALNPATGTVDANVFGKLYQKGKPLSGGLDTAGQFAAAFPTVAKRPDKIGTPDSHNVKALASMLASMSGAATAGPIGAAAGILPFLAPPAARSIMFGKAMQQGLMPSAPQASRAAALAKLLSDPMGLELIAKSAPALASAAQ